MRWRPAAVSTTRTPIRSTRSPAPEAAAGAASPTSRPPSARQRRSCGVVNVIVVPTLPAACETPDSAACAGARRPAATSVHAIQICASIWAAAQARGTSAARTPSFFRSPISRASHSMSASYRARSPRFVGHDRGQEVVAVAERDDGRQHPRQRLPRRSRVPDGRDRRGVGLVHALADDRGDEVAARGKVAVQARAAHARPHRDLGERRAPVAGEQLDGGVEDGLPHRRPERLRGHGSFPGRGPVSGGKRDSRMIHVMSHVLDGAGRRGAGRGNWWFRDYRRARPVERTGVTSVHRDDRHPAARVGR